MAELMSGIRKARALLGMDRLEEAREALVDGLQFEPNDKASRLSRPVRPACSLDGYST